MKKVKQKSIRSLCPKEWRKFLTPRKVLRKLMNIDISNHDDLPHREEKRIERTPEEEERVWAETIKTIHDALKSRRQDNDSVFIP